tara:strand:+ start:623 stop:868 length:246 start_codon:yes stop_codon:yes gene_type:complete
VANLAINVRKKERQEQKMDGLWLGDKILRLVRDKKEKTTEYVMQGSTTEKHDYHFMLGHYRALEEIEAEIKEILDKGEKSE